MGQIIKVQRPVSSAPISCLYVILEAAFTLALLGYYCTMLNRTGNFNLAIKAQADKGTRDMYEI
jgi:hypothetical protein